MIKVEKIQSGSNVYEIKRLVEMEGPNGPVQVYETAGHFTLDQIEEEINSLQQRINLLNGYKEQINK